MLITAEDFERLTVASMDLNQDPDGPLWERQWGRFENYSADGHIDAPPRKNWRWGHWLEEGWASVMLARQFLIDRGLEFEVLYDQNYPTEAGGWVIFTDYHRPEG